MPRLHRCVVRNISLGSVQMILALALCGICPTLAHAQRPTKPWPTASPRPRPGEVIVVRDRPTRPWATAKPPTPTPTPSPTASPTPTVTPTRAPTPTPTPRSAAVPDFDGNGHADIVWHFEDATKVRNRVWLMEADGKRKSAEELGGFPGRARAIVGAEDFDGDGDVDLLWRNQSGGQNVVWFLDGTIGRAFADLPEENDDDWHIAASADFNGDSWPDILWRNPITKQNRVWTMRGITRLGSSVVADEPNEDRQIVGAADFDHDGNADIVWHDNRTGETFVWFIRGVTPRIEQLETEVPTWKIVGVGDFTKDRNPDLLWRNATDGEIQIWQMNFLGRVNVIPVEKETGDNAPGADWTIVPAGF